MKKNKKVFVAMSGGVDSSVAAALLKEEGYNVSGITMQLGSTERSFSGAVIKDAVCVAQTLGIPHHVLDFSEELNDYVIESFTQEYLNGRTPNPCICCNRYVKFGKLFEKIMALGADFMATGHYARICYDSQTERFQLKKARDHDKDQSYFLYKINPKVLDRVLFPLGDKKKEEVRALARGLGLSVAEKEESQDICFVRGIDYRDFIRMRLGDDVFEPGDFIDHEGKVVGQHKGILNYTIGQRDKLGVALGVPVYVYKIDKQTNTVHLGSEEYLYARGLTAKELNLISMDIPDETVEVSARIRYNAREVNGRMTCLEGGKVVFDFDEPQKAVTPGQSVVFCKDDVILGGAIIESSL